MQELSRNQHFNLNEKYQEVFGSVKQALAYTTGLAAPNEEGRFVLDMDASAVAIVGNTTSRNIIEKSSQVLTFMAANR